MSQVLLLVGAGPGIGAAVARRFADEGFAVGLVARSESGLQAQLAPLAADGVRVAARRADAGQPAALRAALADLQAELGMADALVYNAAAHTLCPLPALRPEQLEHDLAVSVVGALAAAQAVLPAMRARGAGTLLFTGGGFAFEPLPALASLGAGKAALRNLAFSLHADLRDTGVHAAMVTVCGQVQSGTAFDPAHIAQEFWRLHAQAPGAFEREVLFRGATA